MARQETPGTMSAVAPGSTDVETVPIPEPAGGAVLVAVESCGICGSDLHWYRGEGEPRTVCPGHEIVGRVHGTPPEDSGLHTGDRVAAEGIHSCGHCPACERGDRQLCPEMEILGLHRPGGFAEFVVVHPRHLHPLAESISPEAATLIEPLAVALHALRIAGGAKDQNVLVLGAGSIGLLLASAARLDGAAQTAITARRPHQRSAAEILGIERTHAPGYAPGGWDIVFETVGSGSGDTLNEALRCVRPGGCVVLLGLFHEQPRIDALALMSKEIRLHGANCYGHGTEASDFGRAAQLLVDYGDQLADALVTHTFSLADFPSALATAAQKTSGSIKVRVRP